MDEDDFFADDDLEGIPDDTLQELELNAWTSTQKPAAAVAVPPSRKQAHNASSLNRASNFNRNLPWRPPQRSQSLSRPASAVQAGVVNDAVQATTYHEYDIDDEVVIDLNNTSAVVQSYPNDILPRDSVQQQDASKSRHGTRSPPDSQTEAAYAAADAQLAHESFDRAPHVDRNAQNNETDTATLQVRVAQLEAEQTRLRKAAQEARNAALAKQGEIAIVRANQDKANKEYERRIAALQKQHAEDTAQHRAELQVRGKEMEKMQTDNRFLQHEAAQEAARSKRRNGASKSRTAPASRETPRKSRIQAIGDGFDDGEVHGGSPSRNRDKSREGTPKAGIKRKRPAPDSPSLSVSHSFRQESSEHLTSFSDALPVETPGQREDGGYEFVQRILSHTSFDNQTLTIEALSRYSFPSAPDKSVASLFMDQVTKSLSGEIEQMPLNIYRALLTLWERCLAEKYCQPFSLLLDLLRFVLHFELSDLISSCIERAIPLCSRTIDLTTVYITTAALYPEYEQHVDWKAQEEFSKQVDSVEVLEFLLSLCHASSTSTERIDLFWHCIEGTFLLTLLSRALPISHITITLQMLQTAALDLTFGPVCNNADLQVRQEHGIVERLTNLLFERPKPPKDEPAYTDDEIINLRLEVLHVLQQMCLTDHGGQLIASHRSAIGRLIRFLDGQICKLYETRPSLGFNVFQEDSTSHPATHDLIVQTVNLTTRIFYHILRTYDSSIDIIQKLSMVQGGYHKFLVSLTRVAFSEQLVFEAGIEDDVITAAHTILDNFLSPEDGEAILKAIETPRGTRGSATERDPTSADASQREGEDASMSDELG